MKGSFNPGSPVHIQTYIFCHASDALIARICWRGEERRGEERREIEGERGGEREREQVDFIPKFVFI